MTAPTKIFGWLPCPVVFVSTAAGDCRDIMTATGMFISEKEPLLTVSLSQGHLTVELIEKSGEFWLSIAAEDQKHLALQLGATKGQAGDKFKRFDVKTLAIPERPAIVPQGVAAWMHCRRETVRPIEGYQVITARVLAQAHLDRKPLVWQQDRFFGLQPV